MIETKTIEGSAVAIAPPKSTKMSNWEGFQEEIKARADELGSQLPSNVSRDRFINAAIAAVKQTPDILKATPRSLFAAITKAAQDGLMPDGREGIITVYGTAASWNPMIFGLRKRARELDGILVDAQVVRENDQFEWEAGDEPKIAHKIKMGDRGKMIGAYAIFKNADEGILHREVMDADQIQKVRDQSRAKDSLMWTKFDTEAWRKTVARRGFKSVPCSAPLERLVQRDDDMFDFTPASPKPSTMLPEIPDDEPALPPAQKDAGPVQGASASGVTPSDDENGDDSGVTDQLESADEFLARLDGELSYSMKPDDVEEAFDLLNPQGVLSGNEDALRQAFELKATHIARAGKSKAPAKAMAPPTDLLGLPEVPDDPPPLTRAQKIAGTP